MENFTLYRKRYIPDETILLKDDIILASNDDYLVTVWKSIKPKRDLAYGSSLYLFHENVKISKFYDHHGNFLCWYCDIVEYEFQKDTNILLTTDLLLDVVIQPDGQASIRDIDELVEAKEKSLITQEQMHRSLLSLDALLQKIYASKFDQLQSPLNDITYNAVLN